MKTQKYACDVCKEIAILEAGQCPKCIQALIKESNHQHTPTPLLLSAEVELQHDLKEMSYSQSKIAFIVRAVNSHEDLLAVAKMVRRLALATKKSELMKRADEAIAKAEGK